MKKINVFATALCASLTITAFGGFIIPAATDANEAGIIFNVDAAAKKGFVKKSGKWYYYKNGKKVTGLNKISGKYYYFGSGGAMLGGEQTIDGFKYYFKTAKDGRSPAVTSRIQKLNGKKYYFSAKGKGFISVGNKTGNKAVGMLMDEITSISSADAKKSLETVYEYIVANIRYVGVGAPDINKKGWQYDTAYETIEKKRGMCYNYASLTGLAAKALGFSAKIVAGKGSRIINGQRRDPSTHAWVLINGKYVVDTNYATSKTDKNYFFKTYDEIKNSVDTTYEENKKF
ncbi:MAG: hypothetical protein K6F00_10420 [Lachnospiraceae bacterium]|nr:hypothetical protein [Lachnospiraceae bacterium]